MCEESPKLIHLPKCKKNICKIYIQCVLNTVPAAGGGFTYLWTYALQGAVHNAFDAGKSITRVSERGLGPGNRDGSLPFHSAQKVIKGIFV